MTSSDSTMRTTFSDGLNCAVREHTNDGHSVGRCWEYVGDDARCPWHGDVSKVQKRYMETGRLTDDTELER